MSHATDWGPSTWGIAAGLSLWFVELLALSWLIEGMKRKSMAGGTNATRSVRLLRAVSVIDLILYPLVGWAVAPILADLIA